MYYVMILLKVYGSTFHVLEVQLAENKIIVSCNCQSSNT